MKGYDCYKDTPARMALAHGRTSGTHGLIEAGVLFQLFDCFVSLLRIVRDIPTSRSS